MAIILNFLSTMFYSRTIEILASDNTTLSDSVSPSPKWGEGRNQFGPSESATVDDYDSVTLITVLTYLTYFLLF